MDSKKQKIITAIGMAALIALVLIWFYPLNKGTVMITTGITAYEVRVDEEKWVPCSADPCSLKMASGPHNVEFQKEKYSPVTAQVVVKRGKLSVLALKPKKIMEILPSNRVPPYKNGETLPPPAGIAAESVQASAWNAEGDKFLYLDKEKGRLNMTDGEKTSPVTVLAGLTPPISLFWSPDGNKAIIKNGQNLYFIGLAEGSRKKETLLFDPSNISWAPGSGYLVFNDSENNVFKSDWQTRAVMPLDKKIPLAQSVWISENTLIYFEMGDGSRASIYSYDINSGATDSLIQKYDFPLDAVIFGKEENKAFFHNPQNGGWYEMDLN
ncbi:hypothetical protein JXA05_02765 [Candidatus Peregrinibacteria bacterium]|nr:hypothetical protein [Candidatus Peregrinibacteria bacterium]